MRQDTLRTLTIPIPEGIHLTFALAGAASRFFAWLIDALAIGVVISAAQRLLAIASLLGPDWQAAALTVAYFFVSTGYAIYMEWKWGGQTIGKRLCSLRVMDAEGLHLTFAQVAIRNVMRTFDILPAAYLLGGAVSFFNRRSMRLGDLAANTVVVQVLPLKMSSASRFETTYNSLLTYPHLIARIRHGASPLLIEVSREALSRRDRLAPEGRLTLFREIRTHFSAIAVFPEAAVEHLTDEQYVRNVIAALFEKRPSRRQTIPR